MEKYTVGTLIWWCPNWYFWRRNWFFKVWFSHNQFEERQFGQITRL